MASISSASNAALRTLQATSQAMVQTQTRISTGLKVNQASDDPIAWSMATQLRGTIKTNDTYAKGLGDAQTQAKLTTNALGQIDKSFRAIRTKVDEWKAADTASDAAKKTSILNEISNLQKDIGDAVKSAKYNGVNWLEKTAAEFTIASGPSMTVTVKVADKLSGATSLFDAVSYGTGGASSAADQSLLNFSANALTSDLSDLKDGLDAVITAIGTAQTNYGSAQTSIEARKTFLSDTNGILSSQLGDLVDADLDEESAKLSALQVRQQLATTALSIINQSQLNILRLFQ